MSHPLPHPEDSSGSRPPPLQALPPAATPGGASGLRIAANAAATIAARTFGFGALGFGLGIAAFVIERSTGGLDVPPGTAGSALVYLLLPLYMAAGTVGLGAAGLWWGVGRVAMNLVGRHQLCQRLVDKIMVRAAARLSKVAPEPFHHPLPVQQVREVLGSALRETEASDEESSGLGWVARAVVRRVQRLVLRRVETWLNALIGEQSRDASLLALTLHRVNALAHERLEGWVMDSLGRMRATQALLWSALFVVPVALPPLALHFLH